MILNLIKDLFLNFAFPKRCFGCDEIGNFVCHDCLRKIDFLEYQQCPACRCPNSSGVFCGGKCNNGFYFDQLIVCCKYDKNSLLRKLITAFKYHFIKDLGLVLAEVLRTQFIYISQFSEWMGKSNFIPVPIHKKRLLYRGFNQSNVLTERLASLIGNDADMGDKFKKTGIADCLFRHQYSHEQATLQRHERLENLVGSIQFCPDFSAKIKDGFCILIDDVATTCSTINECSKVLKRNGARYVCGLVLARGI